jgi:hypothetical protein
MSRHMARSSRSREARKVGTASEYFANMSSSASPTSWPAPCRSPRPIGPSQTVPPAGGRTYPSSRVSRRERDALAVVDTGLRRLDRFGAGRRGDIHLDLGHPSGLGRCLRSQLFGAARRLGPGRMRQHPFAPRKGDGYGSMQAPRKPRRRAGARSCLRDRQDAAAL